MGKAVLPRDVPADAAAVDDEEDEEETSAVAKRDLASFDRALKYAEAALTKGPKVQLGTEAAGVGIIVDNNPTAAAAVSGKAKKRDVGSIPSSKVKVTTMYVRSGIPACE